MLIALLLGFGLSFIGSAPMTGPLALLVVDRVIAAQRASAFWIALAGALVEGVVAAGIGTFLPLVLRHSGSIVLIARVSGALVIFAIGVALLLRPGLLAALKTEHKRESFVAGFLATALNPTLLATWTVTVTALHSGGLLAGGYATGPIFGVGVALGALGWFIFILFVSRHWSSQRMLKYRGALARAIGLMLVAIGIGLFVRAVL
jgi:threonine/homoserine/homoserine lactone efflux protein